MLMLVTDVVFLPAQKSHGFIFYPRTQIHCQVVVPKNTGNEYCSAKDCIFSMCS